MRYETLTLGGNVIRFPVELRAKPSIDLLIDVAPDSRQVELIAEAKQNGFVQILRAGGDIGWISEGCNQTIVSRAWV